MPPEVPTIAPDPLVLCVVPEQQRPWVEVELRFLLPPRSLVFEPSAERALERIGRLQPSLVVVGVDMGTMDAVEFIVALHRRYPNLHQNLIVLPDPEDPFPPIHHVFDPGAGVNVSKWTNREAVHELLTARPAIA